MFASDVQFEVSFALVEAVLFRFADDDAKLDETPLRRSNCTIRISTAEVSHGVSDRCSQPEDRLPSVRELSHALVVNPKTIARVYTELERENVLNTRPGLGVFVAAPSSDLTRKSRRDRSQELLDTLLTDAVHLGLTHDDVQQAIVDRMKKLNGRSHNDADAIVTRQLTKCYDGHRVVNGLNLSIPRGSVYGLLGRNGAGKSTTIKMLTGMVHPDFGQIELLGEDISKMAPERRERIAYIAENHPQYRWMTVKGAIRFARSFYRHWNQTLVDQILDHFEISGRRWIGRMSNGQHAQVSLASALAPDPDLLILDDPTLGLDTVFRRDFLESMIQIIHRTGRTILMTSHILNDVDRVADRIGIMVNGVLRVDCPTEHFKDSIRRVIDDFHETLAANDGMRLVNLEQRTCSLIFLMPQGFQGIHGGRRSGIDEPAKQRGRRFDQLDWYVIIRKVDSLIRMNLDGSDVVRMELPQDVRSYQIYYCETYDGSSYLHASLNVQVFGKTSVSGAIFDVNSSGELSNRRDYAWVNPSGALSETADSFSLGMAMPAPLFTGGAAVFSAATGAPWSPTQNTLRFLPAILSGLIAVFLSRRFQSEQPHSHETFWLMFVVCLGVFGYIGYRYHRRWPPAEFREMKVDTFSAPAANGLEVFA